MRIRTKGDGVKAARAAISEYQRQGRDFERELTKVGADRDSAQSDLDATLENLATGLIASADPKCVATVVQETGAMHLEKVRVDMQDRRIQARDRVTDIAALEDYRQRVELTHPTTGDYSQKVTEHQTVADDLVVGLKPYSNKDFMWLYKRGVHKNRDQNTFSSFWRMVTLADRREQTATDKVLRLLKFDTFAKCAASFDEYKKLLSHHKKELRAWQGKIDAVMELVTEHDDLVAWDQNFDTEAADSLRFELAAHLRGTDLDQIHRNIRPAGKILTAKASALAKKLEYFDDLDRFLRDEISDRETRVASIDRVQRVWARKPYSFMRGDKTKWLVTLPAMKRTSSEKRVRWIGSMRSNISDYDRYDHYSHYMDAQIAFLAYDAFNYGAHERAPYEGFSRGVVSELEDFRVEHDMERADYSDMKDVDVVDSYDEEWDVSADDALVAAEAEAAASLIEDSEQGDASDES